MVSPHILIVDDHPICVTALALAAGNVAAGTRVTSAGSVADIERIATLDQDFAVIFLDLWLADSNGLETLIKARQLFPKVAIAVVSGQGDDALMRQVVAFGAKAFISKAASIEELMGAIRVLLDGGTWFPAACVAPALPVGTAGQADAKVLTPAQLRVLNQAALGLTNKMIAERLGLSEPTVKAHMSAVFKVLKVGNRSQAILALRGN